MFHLTLIITFCSFQQKLRSSARVAAHGLFPLCGRRQPGWRRCCVIFISIVVIWDIQGTERFSDTSGGTNAAKNEKKRKNEDEKSEERKGGQERKDSTQDIGNGRVVKDFV